MYLSNNTMDSIKIKAHRQERLDDFNTSRLSHDDCIQLEMPHAIFSIAIIAHQFVIIVDTILADIL